MRPEVAYAQSVLSGETPASKWVRLACERHLGDLETGGERGLRFNEDQADRVGRFVRGLRHYKGEWAGRRFEPSPWQQFILGNLFGWQREVDGGWIRRFRVGYVEVPKKNGKTFLAGAGALYLTYADDEPAAEVYTVASKGEQARICFEAAVQMVRACPSLNRRSAVFAKSITFGASSLKQLEFPQDPGAASMDGKSVHGAIVDELHAHRSRGVWDVVRSSTGSRRQPLTLAITTAGFDRTSVCWEVHRGIEQVLSGAVERDSWFGYIATVDEESDWQQEEAWRQANPNLNVSVYLNDIREQALDAEQTPGDRNEFLQKRLNVWTEALSAWIPVETWNQSHTPVDPDELVGRRCFAGLDLASTQDINAFVLYFPPDEDEDEDESYVLPYFWVPGDSLRRRAEQDGVPYDVWERQGYVFGTEGDATDYGAIRRFINELGDRYDIVEISFDPHNALQLAQQLDDDGFQVVKIFQSFLNLNAGTKELERLALTGKIAHGGNPVLTWMLSNVVIRKNHEGYIRPDKEKSREKIDGVVALIMALGRSLVAEEENGGSVYDYRSGIVI